MGHCIKFKDVKMIIKFTNSYSQLIYMTRKSQRLWNNNSKNNHCNFLIHMWKKVPSRAVSDSYRCSVVKCLSQGSCSSFPVCPANSLSLLSCDLPAPSHIRKPTVWEFLDHIVIVIMWSDYTNLVCNYYGNVTGANCHKCFVY